MKVLVALLACAMLASAAFAGTITGTVMYDGDAPERPTLTATKDQHCIDAVKGHKIRSTRCLKRQRHQERCYLRPRSWRESYRPR